MPDVRLDAGDAAELARLLQFLGGWLARDPDRLGASLAKFARPSRFRHRAAAPGPGPVQFLARRRRRVAIRPQAG